MGIAGACGFMGTRSSISPFETDRFDPVVILEGNGSEADAEHKTDIPIVQTT